MTGKTTLSKVTGITYLTIGALLLVLGFTHELYDFLYAFIVAGLLVTGGLSVFLTKGMAWSVYLSRIITGSLFVVSGLIKTNDPLGFSYKLQDYFQPGALGWSMFESDGASLTLSIIIAVAEVVLGLAILFGGRMKLSAFALIGMLLFFSWLTYYTASCNDAQMLAMVNGTEFDRACVTDCGCFGDALKDSVVGRSLTPWESFKKDAALLVFALLILLNCGKIRFNTLKDDLVILPLSLIAIAGFAGGLFHWWFPLIFTLVAIAAYMVIKQVRKTGVMREWITALVLTVITAAFTFYTLNYLPIRDFRPYYVGTDFYAAVLGTPDEKDLLWTYKVDGVEQEFWQTDIDSGLVETPWNIAGAEYVDRKDVVLKEGIPVTIMTGPGINLNPEHEQYLYVSNYYGNFALFHPDSANAEEWYPVLPEDIPYMRDSIVASDIEYQYFLAGNPGYTFLACMYDIKKTNDSQHDKIKEIANAAQADGHLFAGLAKELAGVDEYRHQYQFAFDFYAADERILKTMIRSNPGVILLKGGKVIAKWHRNSLPNYDEIANQYLK